MTLLGSLLHHVPARRRSALGSSFGSIICIHRSLFNNGRCCTAAAVAASSCFSLGDSGKSSCSNASSRSRRCRGEVYRIPIHPGLGLEADARHSSSSSSRSRQFSSEPQAHPSTATHTTTALTQRIMMLDAIKELRRISGAPMVDCKNALLNAAPTTSTTTATPTTMIDLDAALDWLRTHGAARAVEHVKKQQGRDHTAFMSSNPQQQQGLVGIARAESSGGGEEDDDDGSACCCLVQVAAETDFAGRSDKFIDLVSNISRLTLLQSSSLLSSRNHNTECEGTRSSQKQPLFPQAQAPAEQQAPLPLQRIDTESLLAIHDDSTGKTIQDLLNEAIVSMRENIHVVHASCLNNNNNIIIHNHNRNDADHGSEGSSSSSSSSRRRHSLIATYVHNRVDRTMQAQQAQTFAAGTAAAMVHIEGSSEGQEVSTETLQSVGKKLAMHIVAAKPLYVRIEDVPTEIVERERDMVLKQQQELFNTLDGTVMVETIVQERLRKLYESMCLLEQAHMLEENHPNMAQYLNERGIEVKAFDVRSIA